MSMRNLLGAGLGLVALLTAGCAAQKPIHTRLIHPKFFPPEVSSVEGEKTSEKDVYNFYEIVVYDVSSGQEKRITNNQFAEGMPIFSQDGKSAIFLRFDKWVGDNTKLMRINLETLTEEELVGEESAKDFKYNEKDLEKSFLPPAFSNWLSENESLCFNWLEGLFMCMGEKPQDNFLGRLDFNQKTLDKLFDISGSYVCASLSPDKKRIAFSMADSDKRAINLYVSNIDGTGRERLTGYEDRGMFQGKAKEENGGSDREWLRGMAIFPTWSPDKTEIAYVSGVTGNFEIHKVNLKTKKITQLTKGEEENWLPLWRKDGIYFIRKQNKGELKEVEFLERAISPEEHRDFSSKDFYGKREIWRIRGDGSHPEKITDTTDFYYGTFDAYSE